MSKPSLPQGTRDFGPEVVRKRNYIISTIKNIFELYGFSPLETPAMENLDTLMGKYGDEGDKLIFKIRSNQNIFEKYPEAKQPVIDILKNVTGFDYTFLPRKSSRALRYDLTIPFARYVAMNFGKLVLPFKRYQIQPVWRGDNPQRGRYREFYQCDADVVGSNSLLNEIELIHIYDTVFAKLGIQVDIKINNRKILAALAELCGNAEKLTDITVAIDKLDKIGLEKVQAELVSRGLGDDQVGMITGFLQITGNNTEKLDQLKKLLSESSIGIAGIAELEYILNYLPATQSNVMIDLTLARGLNYYTGSIFEIKAKQVQMGSIGGGGRYDDLTGLFGVPNIPGVGISFGVDRIYDVLEELKLFPEGVQQGTRVLFFNLGETEAKKSFEYLQLLRNKGIPAEIYPEQAKFDKQFRYAERKQIAWAVMIGSRELENNTCNIKNLLEGAQETISLSKLVDYAF